jgi:hypothetical protein
MVENFSTDSQWSHFIFYFFIVFFWRKLPIGWDKSCFLVFGNRVRFVFFVPNRVWSGREGNYMETRRGKEDPRVETPSH